MIPSNLWTCEILSVHYTAMEEWNLHCGNSKFLGAILNISFYRLYNESDETDMMDNNLYVLGKDSENKNYNIIQKYCHCTYYKHRI